MAGSVDVLGPILEMMTWVGFVPGVPLLVWAWVIAKRRCVWAAADGELFQAGRYAGLRWTDQEDVQRQVLLSPAAVEGCPVAGAVTVHYDVCHSSRYSLGPPRHDHTVLILGWILTSVGILSTLGGLVLLVL
ncbi:hypothetical protein ACIQC5_23015 [Paenarthrobacter sp. NPDC092416]|uniref:hypothetical protein n=1 Tax=Paenarthrobacter sp. NPDC092416 TaxID=3364386 RepID=UPI0037F29D6D